MKVKNVMQWVALALLCVGGASATCNSTYVRQGGSVIAVLPTGSDDTINLQCAFDLAANRPGVTLQLTKGTYITGRILVRKFIGTVRGTGMNSTVIRNPDYPIHVTPDDFYMTAPDLGGEYPYLFVLLGGDYTVTDLTLSIVGAHPATDWSIFGIRDWLGHGITSMAGPVVVLGSPGPSGYREANASFYRIKLQGQRSDDPIFGYNSYNGIFTEGFVGPDLTSLKGVFNIQNSVIDTIDSAHPVLNLVDSRVNISGNTYINGDWAAEVLDLKNTIYEFAYNQVNATFGTEVYDDCLGAQANCGMDHSALIIKNNIFRGTEGVWVEGSQSNGTSGLILGNNFAHVSDVAVYLGPSSSNFTVVGSGKDSVLDFGSGNSITGMTKALGARGQRIKTLLQLAKSH